MMISLLRLFTIVLVCSLTAATARSAEWGNLSGTFIYDGPQPKAVPLTITKDAAFCGKHNPLDESLIVGSGGGLKSVVLYLYLRRGSPKPPVHDSYAATANDQVVLDNDKCHFFPHVVLLRTTQTLLIGNKDAVGHNTNAGTFSNPPFNTIIPTGGSLQKMMTVPELLPASVSCNIHPWMKAWLVVKDNPYMAVTDETGRFEIKNLPVGQWTFQVWHEKSGYVSEVTQNGKATSWRRGRVPIEIKPGDNHLGEIKVAPSMFEK